MLIDYDKIENLAIDDFSSKKREIFNTIFVDNDAKKKIEVINTRDQKGVVITLKKFKNIKTVTRDFSQTYKNSIEEALPNAKQIVDRFHIFKNLTDHITEYLKRTIKNTIKILEETAKVEEPILNERQRRKKQTAERKYELALQIQELLKEGKSKVQISKMLKICRPVVIKYAQQKSPIESGYSCILDKYIPLIKELILEGKRIDEIFSRIREAGYKGKISLLNSRLKGIRQEIRTNIRYLKRSQIKKLLFKDIEEIKDRI